MLYIIVDEQGNRVKKDDILTPCFNDEEDAIHYMFTELTDYLFLEPKKV